MLVVIPYYSGDEAEALRLADWMRELGPYPGHSLLVERDVRCPTRQVFEKMGLAGFDNVEEIVNPQRIDGWPQGGNSVFQFAARHISYTCPQPWLFLEPDAVPMRRNWVDELEKEYKASGKDFLGDFVSIHTPEMDVPDHMSGVGIYPPDLIMCKTPAAGEGLICSQLAWDVVIGQHILPHNMHNSKFLSHAWKHPTFQDWEQVRREIFAFKPDCVLFHASKDGSLILRLQEQRAREAGPLVLPEKEGFHISRDGQVYIADGWEEVTVCDILIKTYPKDYEWLSYCLRGLQKFASGFRHIVVIFPIDEPSPAIPANQPIPVSAVPVAERGEPYLWQQVIKFNAHEWTDATYVLHIDSDTVATASFTPETFIRDGKPLWLMTPYAGIQTPWQPITEKFLGERVDFEFMRRFPMLIPRALHVAASKFVQIRHNKSAADYIMSQPARDFSEFNALGALAYSRARDDFSWLDTTKEELPELVAIQSWSHGGLSDELREKFENILSGGASGKAVGSIPADMDGPDKVPFESVPAAQSFLVGDGLAHAADESPAVPAADQNNLPVPVLAAPSVVNANQADSRSAGETRRGIQGSNPSVAAGNTYEVQQTQNRNESSTEKGQANTETVSGSGVQAVREREETVSDQQSIRSQVSGTMEGEDSCSQGQNPEAENMRAMREPNEVGGASLGLLEATGSKMAMPNVSQGIHQTKEGWWVIDGDTHISKWVEDEGRLDHDQWLLPKILPEINEGDVVVDAGAFIGDHTVAYLKTSGDKGQVICFEPNPLAFECLWRNIEACNDGFPTIRYRPGVIKHNKQVECYRVALSNENIAYPFEILPNASASAIAPRSETNVQAITLDSLKLKRLNFFKIDVEGHELSVLKGAEETIMRCRPKLLIDIHKWPLLRQKVEAKAIFDWLKSHGYRWSSVQPMHVADPPQYDILCRPVTQQESVKKLVPWASPLETKEEISRLISRLNDFVIGASPSQIRFVRQELVVQGVTRRPRDYNWVVIRKKRNAMKRRLAKGIKDEA